MRSRLAPPAHLFGIALGLAVLGAVTGLAFALWLKHGAGIFLAMIDAGISWCF